MKKMIWPFTMAITAVIFISSCDKSDPAPTTSQRIQTKWVFEKEYYHEVETGFPEYRDTTIGVAGDYIDFRTDNYVYTHVNGYKDTVTYSIINDSKMVIDGDTTTILLLNDTQFQIHAQEGNYPTEYYEYTVYMKK